MDKMTQVGQAAPAPYDIDQAKEVAKQRTVLAQELTYLSPLYATIWRELARQVTLVHGRDFIVRSNSASYLLWHKDNRPPCRETDPLLVELVLSAPTGVFTKTKMLNQHDGKNAVGALNVDLVVREVEGTFAPVSTQLGSTMSLDRKRIYILDTWIWCPW